MINLKQYEKEEEFGIHCQTIREATMLVDHIYSNYPHLRNKAIDMYSAWNHHRENTIFYPHFVRGPSLNYGVVGGLASHRRHIIEFSDVFIDVDLVTELGDMPLDALLMI